MSELRICDVHRYALNDTKLRQTTYCKLCDSWICAECIPKLKRRAKAMVNKLKTNKNVS